MNQGDIKLVIDQLDQVAGGDNDMEAIDVAVHMLETFGNKVAELAALSETRNEHIRLWQKSYDEQLEVSRARATKIAEQAALIENLRSVLQFYITNGICESLYYKAKSALAIPTDSKQILKDWMREQLGEPVAFIHDSGLITGDDKDYRAGNRTALVRLPECLR